MTNLRGIPNTELSICLLQHRLIADNDCWLWTLSKTKLGYGKITYWGKTLSVHRASAHVFMGLVPNDKRFVLHKCRNKHCFNPKHLYIGNQSSNIKDSVREKPMVNLETHVVHKDMHIRRTTHIGIRIMAGGRDTVERA